MTAIATYIARSLSTGSFGTYFDLLTGSKWARLAVPYCYSFFTYQLLVESPDSSSELFSSEVEPPSVGASSGSGEDASSGFLANNPFNFLSNPIISLLFPV